MSDVRESIRRAADRREPPEDWLDRIHQRARNRRRSRRVVAGAVGIGLSLVLIVALAGQFREREATEPGGTRPSPAPRCGLGIDVSPTGWWRAERSPSDAVGGRDAILRGGAAYGPGMIGEAFALDGEDDFVEVPDDPALNVGSQDFTVSLWVRFASVEGKQVLIQDWETFDPQTSGGWTLIKQRGAGLAMALAEAGHVNASRLDFPVETWVHVAARRRDGTVSIFLNGALARSRPLRDPQLPLDSSASLTFGHTGPLDSRGFSLQGSLDEIALFAGPGLSDAEIQDVFETQSACVT
jgi:hypothetical protein